jgi:starch-binding outer membrane protein, SusD/RagB family
MHPKREILDGLYRGGTMTRWNRVHRRPPQLGVAIVAFGALGLGACDFLSDLLNVTAPDRIVADTYETPENVPMIAAGMVADFECALAHFITATGIASDELVVTDAVTAPHMLDRRQWDTRGLGAAWGISTCNARNNATPAIYRPISTARWQADNLLNLLEAWSPDQVADRDMNIAKAAAYAGYSLVLLGETMCSAPLDLSAPLSSPQLFAEAESRFTRAISAAETAGSAADAFRYMAHVGLARARLNLGDAPGAAVAAEPVPPGFIKTAGYSSVSTRRYNVVWSDIQANTISVFDPFRNVEFEGVPDPRVPVFNTGRVVQSVGIELWEQSKYPSRESPIPIARYEEAQLILAEAALAAGALQDAVNIINARHAALGLPPFESSDPSEILDQIIYERRAEFFLEGHRFGDIRRFGQPLLPAPGTPYHKGGTYQDNRCLPLPAIETDANPNA